MAKLHSLWMGRRLVSRQTHLNGPSLALRALLLSWLCFFRSPSTNCVHHQSNLGLWRTDDMSGLPPCCLVARHVQCSCSCAATCSVHLYLLHSVDWFVCFPSAPIAHMSQNLKFPTRTSKQSNSSYIYVCHVLCLNCRCIAILLPALLNIKREALNASMTLYSHLIFCVDVCLKVYIYSCMF